MTAAHGWREHGDFTALMTDVAHVNAMREDAFLFLAERGGVAIAAGALMLADGLALLAGASTVPEHRKQGAQRALLEGRLQFVAGPGCDLAMMCSEPRSGSQRNAERHGFRIAYTQIKWQRQKGRMSQGVQSDCAGMVLRGARRKVLEA